MNGQFAMYKIEALKVRKSILETVKHAGRGHIPSAFSLVEILLVLYGEVLNISPETVDFENRDRLILSKGHGCLALYCVLAEYGFISKNDLTEFCSVNGLLGGHPEQHINGVEASTGALGHGLSIGVGMALNSRIDGVDYFVYVIIGDGECGEGSIWEAALSASKHNLNRLVVLIDYNKFQSYGPVQDVLPLEPFADKWKAFGFRVQEVDMDQPQQLHQVLTQNKSVGLKKPLAVICHTIKGKGIEKIENNPAWHHKAKFENGEIDNLIQLLEIE